METEFRTLYVDSGLHFSSLRGKNQFPNQLHGSKYIFLKAGVEKEHIVLLASLTNQLHSMMDAHSFSKKRGIGILGISFFTALWILYMSRCALSATAETDRALERASRDKGWALSVSLIQGLTGQCDP